MGSKIRVLNEHTINQIAAGEVIENPASVVKELVENAIDAGASDICVEIKGGGRQLIRVTDNGCGMNADDAMLCLERHATSKMREIEDIHSLMTMGFRGEAIPSIASISKLMILTCPQKEEGQQDPEGTLVIVDGGKIMQCSPAARSSGTTIEVKSLFFNVPVRRKFQKSPTYDQNEILKVLSIIALGHPEIKFQLISNQQTLLSTSLSEGSPLDQLGNRISSVLGPEFFNSMCPVEHEMVRGYIGLPSYTRQNRTGQYLFINKRAIFSPLISYGVREGYGTTLSANRYPVYVLHLHIPGSLVDVNVHPQKREVRFRQDQVMKEKIIEAVKLALQGSPFEAVETAPLMQTFATAEALVTTQAPYEAHFPKTSYFDARMPSFSSMPIRPNPVVVEQPLFEKPSKVIPKVMATLPNYLLVDSTSLMDSPKNSLCLVDQRAAHARIIFERMEQGKRSAVQNLLLPITLQMTPVEASVILEHVQDFNRLGISIREIGPHSFLVDAIPQMLFQANIEGFIHEMVTHLKEYRESKSMENEKLKAMAQMASRGAVPYDKRFSIEEGQMVLNQLMDCQSPLHCPFGKPIFAYLNQEHLSKLFK